MPGNSRDAYDLGPVGTEFTPQLEVGCLGLLVLLPARIVLLAERRKCSGELFQVVRSTPKSAQRTWLFVRIRRSPIRKPVPRPPRAAFSIRPTPLIMSGMNFSYLPISGQLSGRSATLPSRTNIAGRETRRMKRSSASLSAFVSFVLSPPSASLLAAFIARFSALSAAFMSASGLAIGSNWMFATARSRAMPINRSTGSPSSISARMCCEGIRSANHRASLSSFMGGTPIVTRRVATPAIPPDRALRGTATEDVAASPGRAAAAMSSGARAARARDHQFRLQRRDAQPQRTAADQQLRPGNRCLTISPRPFPSSRALSDQRFASSGFPVMVSRRAGGGCRSSGETRGRAHARSGRRLLRPAHRGRATRRAARRIGAAHCRGNSSASLRRRERPWRRSREFPWIS